MRLDQLHLTRYGRFTDTRIDFAAPPVGGSDMHIIFGPNEAGKSTLFSAWLDLLFGIPQQTRYSFLHAGPTMEVGAKITHSGNTVDLVRRKGRGTTLYDTAGNGLPDGTLMAALGGLSRDGYSAMFSLDDETIEQGGEAILSSGGELGQLLFSASAGLSGLTRQMDAFRDGIDGFHRKGKRSGTLYDGKKHLEELAKTARGLETTVAEQKRRSRDLDEAQQAWRTARLNETKMRDRLGRVQAALNMLPLERMLADAQGALATLGNLPDATKDDLDELTELGLRRAKLDERNETLRRQIEEIGRRLDPLVPDSTALAQDNAIAEAEALRAEHDSAIKDLPRRTKELEDVAHEIAVLLTGIGKSGATPTDVILPAGVLAQLRGLLNQRSGLMIAASRAVEEAQKVQDHLEAERKRFGDVQENAEAQQDGRLATILSRLTTNDPAEKKRQAERDHDSVEIKLQLAIEKLAPWRGDADMLAGLIVPTQAHIDNWRIRSEKTRQAEADALRDRNHHDERVAALRIDLAGHAPLDVNMLDAAQARSDREALWAAHLAEMSYQSAKSFEAALRRDDQMTAMVADAITRRQRHDDTQVELAELLHKRDLANTLYDNTRAKHQQLVTEITANCDALNLSGIGLSDLERWIGLRADALRLREDYLGTRVSLSRADEDLLRATASLAAILGQGVPQSSESFENLFAEALSLHRNAEKHVETRNLLNRLDNERAERQDQRERAETALNDWKIKWQDSCAGTILEPLGYGNAQVDHLLDRLDELANLSKAHANLEYRVTAMQQNRDRFVLAKGAIIAALDMAETASWTEVISRRDMARTTEVERQNLLAEQKARQNDLWQNNCDLTDHGTAVAHLGARVIWSPEIGNTLKDHIEACVEATRLRAEIDRLSDQLQNRQAPDEDTAHDENGLKELVAALTVSVEEARIEAERLQDLASNAQHALDQIGGDDALARVVSERENLRLSLQEQTKEHLSRRFGLIALEFALRRYRENHQSAMLTNASQAFERLSHGAYPSLSVVTQGNNDKLIAIARNGATRMAADMSKGTRFQLYLALRMAGYHEIAKSRPPVPFIADDIMETFDDDRAAAAFSLLGEMSRTGQVIYLTHHKHLCDIAQAACPDAHVINLRSGAVI